MLSEKKIDFFYPLPFYQTLVDLAIADEVHGIKSSGSIVSQQAMKNLDAVILYAKKSGVNTILLGCTELSIAIESREYLGCRVIDPINIISDRFSEICTSMLPKCEEFSIEANYS